MDCKRWDSESRNHIIWFLVRGYVMCLTVHKWCYRVYYLIITEHRMGDGNRTTHMYDTILQNMAT